MQKFEMKPNFCMFYGIHMSVAISSRGIEIYPLSIAFLLNTNVLNRQNRICAVRWNGTWDPKAVDMMRKALRSMKKMDILRESFLIHSSWIIAFDIQNLRRRFQI